MKDQIEDISENKNAVVNYDVNEEIKQGLQNLKSMCKSVNLLAGDSFIKYL